MNCEKCNAAEVSEEFTERAAIMEYDGNLSREEAERRTREALCPRYPRPCDVRLIESKK